MIYFLLFYVSIACGHGKYDIIRETCICDNDWYINSDNGDCELYSCNSNGCNDKGECDKEFPNNSSLFGCSCDDGNAWQLLYGRKQEYGDSKYSDCSEEDKNSLSTVSLICVLFVYVVSSLVIFTGLVDCSLHLISDREHHKRVKRQSKLRRPSLVKKSEVIV